MNGTPERGSPCRRSVSVLLNAGGVNCRDGMVFYIFAIFIQRLFVSRLFGLQFLFRRFALERVRTRFSIDFGPKRSDSFV